MKSKLLFIPTANMSREQWLTYRHDGLGASEVGTILGLDDYMSSLELFYYKIGEIARFDTETIYSFMGRYHEDTIADLWQYWEGDEETMIANYKAGKIVRRCMRVNAFVRNPEYPWLYVSLDRKINKTETRGEGSLELKTISGFEADKWESGLPPKYVVQLNTQTMVGEFEFGEMAILQDGRRFFVLPFENSKTIQETIVKKTFEFWCKVLDARKLVNAKYIALQDFNYKRADGLTAAIDLLAPEPDGSQVYADFLKKKYNRPLSAERQGTEAEFVEATVQKLATEQIKTISEGKIKAENCLKTAMGDRFQMLDFGSRGRVYWSMNGAGHRVFRNKIKL